MAEISLREYLEKVDALLKTGKSDEVILHTRQILKHYPKNVAASRYLGQALVRGSDYKEAEPVLRRVLSVYPDDVVAHTGLSDMNDRQGKSEEAIWHIERALEGAPNDSALIEKWRSLYQRYRKVEDPRFQLTTGAVARQYTRNGLYAQAIETLNTTLEKSPRRVDLRLLLAQTMWNAGMQVEGAETALDVLDVLPYCLEANRILTLLWLAEGRPSDAQRYLNQIQEAEPYQALQLAQNTAPDDDAFTVPELDYRRITESQINTDQPDWLTDIDEEEPAPVSIMTEMDDEAFDLDDELPEAFLTDLETEDAPPVVTRPKTGMTGLLAALEQPQDLVDDEVADELPVSDELPDWLMESAPQEAAMDMPTSLEEEADPLAWLEDSGTELTDAEPDLTTDFDAIQKQTGSLDWLEQPAQQDTPDFFGDTDFAEAVSEIDDPVEHNALAWLEGSGVELIDESEMPPASSLIDEEEMVYSDPEQINPLAWLESSGVELVEDATTSSLFEEQAQPEAPQADAMAWLEAESQELAGEDPQSVLSPASDTLDWLNEAEAEELPSSGFLNTPMQSSADEDSLDWLQDDSILDEMLDIEELSDTGGLPAADTLSTPDFFAGMDGVTDRLPGSTASNSEFTETGGQNEMSDEKNNLEPQSEDSELSSFEWLNEEPEAESNVEASTSDLDWMTEIPDEQPEWLNEENGEPESAVPTTGGPDWLAEEAGTVTNEFGWLNETGDEIEASGELAGAASALDWLSGGDDEDEEAAAEPAEMPDWLSAAAPVADDSEAEAPVEAETFSWSAEAEPVGETPDWLSAIAPGAADDAEEEAEPAAEMADWLASAQPNAEAGNEEEIEVAAEAETFSWSAEAEPVGETPDWLSAIAPGAADDAEDEAEPAAEMAGWLASAQPNAEADNEEEIEVAAQAETFDWSEEESAAEPIGEAPDWLSAIAPGAENDEPEEMVSMSDWLSDEEDEQEAVAEVESFDWSEEEPAAQPIGEAPDWLSAIAPDAADVAEDEAEPVAEMAEMPDWLASAQPTDEDDDEEEIAVAAEVESFDWSEDEPEAEAISETPDWLSAIAPTAEDTSEIESELEADLDALELEAEAEEAEPIAEMATEMPDWLASAQPIGEDDETEAEVAAEVESSDWSEEEPEAEPISETPDWLSAAAPVAEVESEIESELDALEWEADEVEPAAELAAMPDWLANAQPTDEDDEVEVAAEVPDWSDEEPEAEPITDLPEWLTDAEPEGELEDDAQYTPASVAQTRILPDEDFGWAGDEDEPEYETDYEAEPANSQFGWVGEPDDEAVASAELSMLDDDEMEFEEKVLASASTPLPADNAPDWLNAMVPGLDLDYQAIEDDQPIESEYIEVPARREQPAVDTSQPGNFNWLVDIVDEETGPMRAIQDAPRTRSRFTFSRQPAWLRTLLARRESTDSESDDDFELPEWLR